MALKKATGFVFIWAWCRNWPIAVLGCARIGAIHQCIFGGFSAQSIADRLQDANAEFIITCDGAFRGDKDIPLKSVIDDALIAMQFCKKSNCIIHERVHRLA